MAKNDPSLSESGLAPSNGAIEDVQPLSAEGAPEDTQLAEKWWTEVADEDSLRSHDRLRPWLEETEDKARRDSYQRLQPLINQRNTYLGRLTADSKQMVRDFERAQRDGMLGRELLDEYEEFAGKVSGAYWHLGRFDGAKGFLLELSNALGDKDILEDFAPRVELLEQGATDAKLFPDLLKRLARGAKGKEDADAEKKGYERGLTEGRNAALEEMRAQGRQGRGPDLARKGPGGGSLLTAERYRSMSPEERRKLSPEEIDRMTAEYVAQFPRR